MFDNRISNFVPGFSPGAFTPALVTPARDNRAAPVTPMAVQLADIYQAAVKRAVEDHELDKLFNPDLDDYQI